MLIDRWDATTPLPPELSTKLGDRPSLLLVSNPHVTDLSALVHPHRVLASLDSAHPDADLFVSAGEMQQLRDVFAANPVAATVCARQLRLAEHQTVAEALRSESEHYRELHGGEEFSLWLAQQGRRVRPAFPEPPVIAEDFGHTVILTLNRPRLRNAFTAEMRNHLIEILDALAFRSDLTSLVVRGAGNSFCIGGDLAEFGTVSSPAEGHRIRMATSVAARLVALSAHITFEVHGAVIGAGVELAAFGHRVVATRDATFRLPEVTMGLLPGVGGTFSVTQRIGRQNTARMLLLDQSLSANDALQLGLIDKISTNPTTNPTTNPKFC